MSGHNSADVPNLVGSPGSAGSPNRADPLKLSLRRLWGGLRQLSGDDAYERYLEHHRRVHPDAPLLDRRQFWCAEVERRWSSGPCRCC